MSRAAAKRAGAGGVEARPTRTKREAAAPGRPFVAAIVGTDGCGKTSVFRLALDRLSERFRVAGVGELVLTGGPGEPLRERRDVPLARSAGVIGRFAKGLKQPWAYRALKLLELAERSRIREGIAATEEPAAILTDGDPLVNVAAWAASGPYRDELREDDALLGLLTYLAGETEGAEVGEVLGRGVRVGQILALGAKRLGHFRYPDLVVLLEIEPEVAMARIAARGRPLQAHESAETLGNLGAAYGRVCGVLQAHRGVPLARIRADRVALEDAVQAVFSAVTEHLPEASRKRPRKVQPDQVEIVATTISGSIKDQRKIDYIEPELQARTERPVNLVKAHSHAEARRLAHDLIKRGARTVVSAGGAGTFNAVLEGAHLDGTVPKDLRIAFLRKGSADLIGKALGIPDDLAGATQAIVDGVEADTDVVSDVLAVEAESPTGEPQLKHMLGFGGLAVFGEIPRFTETRVVKLYKGILGQLFGDLGPFAVGVTLATAWWQFQRLVGRVPRMVLVLDGEELPADTWGALLLLNGDLGHDFPLGRGLPFGSGSFRVVALRYRGLDRALAQAAACRSAKVLERPEHYDAVVRTVRTLEARPLGSHPYMVNVDGLRMFARGPVKVSVSGQVRLIAPPSSPARRVAEVATVHERASWAWSREEPWESI